MYLPPMVILIKYKKLADYKVLISKSTDSMDEKIHDEIRGRKDLKRAIEA